MQKKCFSDGISSQPSQAVNRMQPSEMGDWQREIGEKELQSQKDYMVSSLNKSSFVLADNFWLNFSKGTLIWFLLIEQSSSPPPLIKDYLHDFNYALS